MIVIASDNPVLVEEISNLLKQRGDLFAVVQKDTTVSDAIRTNRADLLVLDTISPSYGGSGLCRTVKNDPELQGLPVLCIIEPGNLSALLSVLDCGGDAFLARPFDPEALSGAIDDLKEKQAEIPLRAGVQTRFRINHEGTEYSVVAGRRRLLEFLLTAFETAVRMRGDQERMRSDLMAQVLSISNRLGALTTEHDVTVKNLREELEERTRAVSRLSTSLQAKEQSESLSRTRLENVASELKELGTVLEATRRSDEEKDKRISELESAHAEMQAEKVRIEQEHTSTIRTHETRIREAVSDMEAHRSLIAGLQGKNAELERMLVSGRADHDRDQETIRSLSGDMEQAIRARDEGQKKCEQLETSVRQIQAAAEAKDLEVRSAIDNLNGNLRALQSALEQNIRQLEQELALRRDLEDQIRTLTRERDSLSRSGGSPAGPAPEIRPQAGPEVTAQEREREKTRVAGEGIYPAQKESAEKDRIIPAPQEEPDTAPSGKGAEEDTSDKPEDDGMQTLSGRDSSSLTQLISSVPPQGIAAPPAPVAGERPRGSVPPVQKPVPELLPSPPASFQLTLPPTEPGLPLQGGISLEGEPGSGSSAAVPAMQERLLDQEHAPGTADEGGSARQAVPRGTPELMISRDRWLDITKWAHHTEAVTPEQRKDILATLMRLSKLVQKGRHLTNRQEQEIRSLVARVQALGYRFV